VNYAATSQPPTDFLPQLSPTAEDLFLTCSLCTLAMHCAFCLTFLFSVGQQTPAAINA